MRVKIFLTMCLILSMSISVFAQEPTENVESEKTAQTRLFDEFPPVGECELAARIQNIFVELGQTSNAKGYIIVYRGADAVPARQTRSALENWFKAIKMQMMFMKLDTNRVEMIDGGFRKTSSIWNEVFIVPEGGVIPQPTDTVEKPKTPTAKAFKADEGFLENAEALIKKDEEIYQETEESTEEVPETTEETPEPEAIETENSVEPNAEVEEEIVEETQPFWWFSEYFAEAMNEAKDARGLIIFYTNEDVYDVAKSRQIVEEGLQNLADKSKVNLSNVKIIFGGYRSQDRVEYWIIPKGAEEPQPTPELKPIKETEEKNSVN